MRNRYLDLLRAAAILRVIVYHLYGWPWLSIVLPAMGVMFALAGSLAAASLDTRPAGQVVASRLRRLLPPLWLLAVIAVPAMLYLGWSREQGGDEPLSWKLGLWLLPIGDPPGSQRGIDVWEPLWYIRAYLWFVVLSPVLYLAYKKIGWGAVAAPIVLIAVLDRTGFALPFGRADAAMWDFATYGACWIAGFAHHDGRLARVRPGLVVAASAVLGLAALYWLHGHAPESGWDLNEVPESQALWSLAFVLLALRWQPDMTWLQRYRRLDGAVDLLNARAVTIYLWHNIAIAAIWPVLTVLALDDLGGLDGLTDLVASLALTVAAVLAFGWAEDLAARRKPALWPTGGRRRSPSGDAPAGGAPAGGPADLPGLTDSTAGHPGLPTLTPTRPGLDGQTPGAAGSPGSSRPVVPEIRSYGRFDAAGTPGHSLSGDVPGGPGGGPRYGRGQDAPWVPAGAAPVVVGDSAFALRRRDHVAPFPEAEVSFGLPDDRPATDRDKGPDPGSHATGPAVPEPAQQSGKPAPAPSWFGGDTDKPA